MNGTLWVKREHSAWAPERIERLKELAGKGLSGSQIAELMGISRGSAIGKLRREGIPLTGYATKSSPRRTPTKVEPKPKPKPKPLAAAMPTAAKGPGKAGRRPPSLPAYPAPPINDACEGIAAAVMALKDGECRWPLGERRGPPTGFCRAPVDFPGKSYCEYHAHISQYGDPNNKSEISYEEQRQIILSKLVAMRRVRTSEVAEAIGSSAQEATDAIQRTKAWLLKHGIRVSSAEASGYWICPADKHLAIALSRTIGIAA